MPYGQRPAPSATTSSLGGTSCVPGGSALRAPTPHDATFTGPRRPDPDGDISAGLLLPPPIGLAWRPCTLHSLMGGALAPWHLHPQAPPLFRPFGIIMGGLHSPPLLLLVIMGGLQPPPLFLLVIMVGLPSLPLPLGLCGPRQDRRISHRFWGALLLRPFLHLFPVRSRLFHHWWRLP